MIMDAFSIKGQTGIVTGGGKGLGCTYCHLLSEAGASVVIAEIDEETGQEAAESIPNALYIHTDVTDRASVEAMLETALSRFGKVDFLVNNAGKWKYAPAQDLTQEDWHDVMDLNLNGVLNCCQIVGRQMGDSHCGENSITTHIGIMGGDTTEEFYLLFYENLRGYVAGEPLLNVIDKAAGY